MIPKRAYCGSNNYSLLDSVLAGNGLVTFANRDLTANRTYLIEGPELARDGLETTARLGNPAVVRIKLCRRPTTTQRRRAPLISARQERADAIWRPSNGDSGAVELG
jgi:hypothetical protein